MRFAPKPGAGTTRATFLQPNPVLLSRLVGYVEYRRAIDHLEKLVHISSADELHVADAIVKEWDRYIVRVSLNRRDSVPSASQHASGSTGAEHDEKHGLAWVMALARVELGAMVAVAMLDTSAHVWSRPTQFDRQEFIELLSHDTIAAVNSLRNDPFVTQLLQNNARRPNEHQIQIYCQRLTMIEALIQACLHLSPESEQLAHFRKTNKQVHRLRLSLVNAAR